MKTSIQTPKYNFLYISHLTILVFYHLQNNIPMRRVFVLHCSPFLPLSFLISTVNIDSFLSNQTGSGKVPIGILWPALKAVIPAQSQKRTNECPAEQLFNEEFGLFGHDHVSVKSHSFQLIESLRSYTSPSLVEEVVLR